MDSHRPPVVLIDRFYEDDLDLAEQPWPRLRRWPDDPRAWLATHEHGDLHEEVEFDEIEEAIAWGRERAEIVLVRLGTTRDTCYSAGAIRAHESLDGSGEALPPWPPDNWPSYLGPDAETRSSS